jgi:Spx/MgsR family transcriptional regulator
MMSVEATREAAMISVHGLKSCETCRKALAWLKGEGIAHSFHDVRAERIDAAKLDAWIGELGWQALLNTRGTTWRNLPDSQKTPLDETRARDLILAHPALMKRPVFDLGSQRLVGFREAQKQALRRAR